MFVGLEIKEIMDNMLKKDEYHFDDENQSANITNG